MKILGLASIALNLMFMGLNIWFAASAETSGWALFHIACATGSAVAALLLTHVVVDNWQYLD